MSRFLLHLALVALGVLLREAAQRVDWLHHPAFAKARVAAGFLASAFSHSPRAAVDFLRATGHAHPQCLDRRLARTNVLTKAECATLIALANNTAHLQDETKTGDALSGVNLFTLAEDPGLDLSAARLLNDTRYRVKHIVQSHFGIPPSPGLHFDYTHLTRRLPGREAYSHGLHADACVIQEGTKECRPDKRFCCHWRTHSAILFLSERADFEGGEFFFSPALDDSCGGQEIDVRPACGTLVAFSSGAENVHAVRRVTAGERFVLAIWFTEDASRAETPFVSDFGVADGGSKPALKAAVQAEIAAAADAASAAAAAQRRPAVSIVSSAGGGELEIEEEAHEAAVMEVAPMRTAVLEGLPPYGADDDEDDEDAAAEAKKVKPRRVVRYVPPACVGAGPATPVGCAVYN